jgi:hypothetical protein
MQNDVTFDTAYNNLPFSHYICEPGHFNAGPSTLFTMALDPDFPRNIVGFSPLSTSPLLYTSHGR